MKKILLLPILLGSFAAKAVLPPYEESAREIAAILAFPDVSKNLNEHPIDSFVKTQNGYRVTAGDCFVDVDVKIEPLPAGMVGPGPLHLKVTSKKCLEKKEISK